MESFDGVSAESALSEIERLEAETVFGTADAPTLRYGKRISAVIFILGCVALVGFFWLSSRYGLFAGLPLVVVFVAALATWEKRKLGVSSKVFQRSDLQRELFTRHLPTGIAMCPMIWGCLWADNTEQPLWVFVAIVVLGMAVTLAVAILSARRYAAQDAAHAS